MRRPAPLLALTLLAAAFTMAARAGPVSSGHRADPFGRCFWVHGRLFAANGAPTFRIHRIGSKRILGVKASEDADAAIDDLPQPVRALVSPDAFQVDVDGDYRVCPFTGDHPGRMRLVRIDQALHLVARAAISRGRSNE